MVLDGKFCTNQGHAACTLACMSMSLYIKYAGSQAKNLCVKQSEWVCLLGKWFIILTKWNVF